ncbi:kinase-like domain-containing protein [Pyronema omphalodes]|nr:kinase-like domain-containing protein [Pyronema omphalodes]
MPPSRDPPTPASEHPGSPHPPAAAATSPATTWSILPSFKTYESGVSLLARSCSRRTWSLGTNVIMKESPYDSPSETPFDEQDIVDFLSTNTSIPVNSIIAEWIDDNATHFIIKEKLPGESLQSLWPTMSWEEKGKIADQVAEMLRELRDLTSNRMERVKEMPFCDQMLFNHLHPHLVGPLENDQQLWAKMVESLKGAIPAPALRTLGRMMPPCQPYTFTHGDLSMGNIIVDKGKVTGIVDWEWSFFAPVWWEYVKFRAGTPRWIDPEWFELLDERMDQHPAAVEFYSKFQCLVSKVESHDPKKIRSGHALIQELMADDEENLGGSSGSNTVDAGTPTSTHSGM